MTNCVCCSSCSWFHSLCFQLQLRSQVGSTHAKEPFVELPTSPYCEADNFLLVKECFYAYGKLIYCFF